MSEIASHSTSPLTSGTLSGQLFVRICQSGWDAVRAWRMRMRQRRELLMLNDVELRELSLTEADVIRETSKLFWESIRITDR
jgi:uncharacterized protein YjiS (DUF1127 family)